MIEIAAILSAVVRHWTDFVIICVLLVFNAIIGFWQEHKADNAIKMLKRKLAVQCRVFRSGRWKTLPARELVPGDLVRLRLGDIIPADVKLTNGDSLEIDQSVLTGESLPSEKKIGDTVYSGSITRRGETDGEVAATGMNTYFGKTTRLVQEAHTTSHYQKAVLQIGHFLIMITIALVALIITVAIFRHTPILETIQFCLILTVAAIPVALPAVLSVTMAVGAMKLARRQAIVSRLVSIEELAGMDVLCSDKTGTLTKNQLVLDEPVVFDDTSPDEVLRCAVLASRAEDQDPIEKVIFEIFADKEISGGKYEIKKFLPFDPEIKRTEATVRYEGNEFKVSKGAPQAIMALLDKDAGIAQKVNTEVDELAAHGRRVLGVAKTDERDRWRFLGLLPMFDPPREDSADTLSSAAKMGIEVKMITGDHLAIAKETAQQLGMQANILPVDRIFNGGSSHEDDSRIESAEGFAQVMPEHKYKIISTLQKLKHFVGMTGDGVNDAPALKQADVGIAVEGATDAARSAADLILTAPGLSVIVEAIKEARRIFRRMNAYAIYRIAETIRILLFMTLSIIVFNFYPITAIMIIMLALLNDGAIMMIAFDRTSLPARPARWNMHSVLTIAVVLGLTGLIASFSLFWIGERWLHLDRETIRTLIFLKLAVAGHMTIYLSRTGDKHFWEKPAPAPLMLGILEINQVIATLLAVYGFLMQPIGWTLAFFVWGYALLWFMINDQIKVHATRMLRHGGSYEQNHLHRITTPLHN
jgi:H+-transporting ATPase